MPESTITFEQRKSQSGDRDETSPNKATADLEFNAFGSDDQSEIESAAEESDDIPSAIGNRTMRSFSYDRMKDNLWIVRVRYSALSRSGKPTGTSTFKFRTSGAMAHITHSRQTVSVTVALDESSIGTIGGAIGYDGENIAGTDIVVPAFQFTVTRRIPKTSMTSTYIGKLRSHTGRYNSSSVTVDTTDGVNLTFASGELLFDGVPNGGFRDDKDDWEIDLDFAANPNETNILVAGGGITVPSKLGWDYLWVRTRRTVDSTTNRVTTKPIAAYVERVYLSANLNELLA